MTGKASWLRKVTVLLMAFAIVVAYSVVPMSQAYAATKKPTKITLTATSKTVDIKGKVTVSVKSVKPTGASKAVTYKSSNKKIATVNSKGVVTGKKKGTVKITVTSKKNKKVKKTIKIKVKQLKPTKIKLNKTKLSLETGSSATLKATLLKVGTYGKVYFKSLDTSVAKVGKTTGKVTAVGPGTVKIKAYTTKKNAGKAVSKVCTVTVTDPAEVVEKDPVLSDRITRTMTTVIDMTDAKYDGNVVRVWVPVPQSNDEQGIWGETFEAPAAAVAEFKNETSSGFNNKELYLEWSADTAAADRTATLTYNVSRYKVSIEPEEDTSAAIPDEVKPFITKESEYVKVNADIVQKYAAEATEGKTGTLEKARAIYDWVIANLERIDNGETLECTDGSTHTFSVVGCGYGDTVTILEDLEKYGRAGGHCTDINSTFVALCRASGIPAREMFGCRMSDNATGGQHCWAQFYLPGTGWVYADPADVLKFGVKENKSNVNMTLAQLEEARKSELTAQYTATYWASVDNNRVELSRGRDLILEPAQNVDATYNTFGYPCGEYGTDAAGYTRIECTNAKEFVYTISCEDGPQTMTGAELSEIGVYKDSSESGYKILDVRHMDKTDDSKTAYEVAHIPGAVAADVDGAVFGTDAETAKANIENAIAGDADDMKYVLICYTGNKYANAAKSILTDLGVSEDNIYILAQDNGSQGSSGGMAGWKGAVVNSAAGTVTLKATMNDTIHMGSHNDDVTHHIVVNKDGSNGDVCAMYTDALPGEVYRGLVEIGAAPGDTFTGKCDAGSITEGDKIDMNFAWDGGSAGVEDLFKIVTAENTDGTVETADFNADMRFSGNIANLDLFDGDYNQTGCITCTFSCWIGTVSNAAYGYSTSEAYVNRDAAPDAGTEVTVTYSVAPLEPQTITAAELSNIGVYKDPSESGYKVLDVRPAAKYAAGHIPGAVAADVDGAKTGDDVATATANIEAAIAGDPDDMKYVVVCNTGNSYANAAREILLAEGIANDNILILAQDDGTQGSTGGMVAWKGAVVNPTDNTVVLKATMNDTIHMGSHNDDVTHHIVVNKDGSNGDVCAMYTDALPGEVYRGLVEIGAAPGDTFTGKCDAGSITEGDKIDMNFAWDGGSAGVSDLFKIVTAENTDGTVETADFDADMRFSGNIANLDLFDGDYNQTGCITCTFSCWIGTVSNAAYGYSTSEAYVNRDVAPDAGTEITVTYSVGE